MTSGSPSVPGWAVVAVVSVARVATEADVVGAVEVAAEVTGTVVVGSAGDVVGEVVPGVVGAVEVRGGSEVVVKSGAVVVAEERGAEVEVGTGAVVAAMVADEPRVVRGALEVGAVVTETGGSVLRTTDEGAADEGAVVAVVLVGRELDAGEEVERVAAVNCSARVLAG